MGVRPNKTKWVLDKMYIRPMGVRQNVYYTKWVLDHQWVNRPNVLDQMYKLDQWVLDQIRPNGC